MRQTIQKITQKLIDRLPENDQYYTIEELRSWEFPSFIVRRISVELKRNLSDSMIIPKTDWANTSTDAVLDAWQQFIDAIEDEARLPASYAQAVIETAVSDVMEILVQPRKNVPEVIFGAKDELSIEQLHQRLEAVVVYRHFAVVLSRYVQKKDLETLSKEHCSTIIAKADEKLTSGYSPLNWAQILEPLFQLQDDGIDTNLLRLFFEDKKMARIARKFDLMNTVLSRVEFIEVLSSPELLDFDGYEDDQSSLFEDQPTAKKEDSDSDSSAPILNNGEEDEIDEEEELQESESEDEQLKSDETEEIEDEEDDSLNGVFREESKEEEEEEVTSETEEEKIESEDEESGNQDISQEVEEEDSSPEKKTASLEEQEDSEADADITSESEEETPIWMRYMSDEEVEEYEKEHGDGEDEEVDEDGFIDEPIIDLTKEDASDEEIKNLRNMLSDEEKMFVEEIFRGSDRAFDQAIEDIAGYDSWREVSKYIEKDIFKRNLVDMYCEAAVDFTDRLQSYFLEKQNRNKQEN
ncbi:hypothetical protein CK503_06145 [Aliifodinibius salipaludis]|uniref:Uncharacterized protein n=1 Tax=Fodinibius salipaludis TaxID=2032627 RepID=A0A2A2G9W7_9BACT|nr:hypothetical protein [Aliifodinibius salipaludis]PAU94381.1 hypothetical protein CK503_06145 [Aliifodinibius salipaludis]